MCLLGIEGCLGVPWGNKTDGTLLLFVSNIRTVPCAYATPTSNGLLNNLIQFIINIRNRKGSVLRLRRK